MNVRAGDKDIAYSTKKLGGHAFAIVAYDRTGFWIQNSWGRKWGAGGFARLSYADWLENGTDVWVARLGAPVDLSRPNATPQMRAAAPRSYESVIGAALRPHIVTLENDGRLREKGSYGLTPAALRRNLRVELPAAVRTWPRKRVVVYAHGGLVTEEAALQQAASLRAATLAAKVYPIAIIWRSDFWTTVTNILEDAFRRRRDEGVLDAAKDFLLDRLDDTLESLAVILRAKMFWDEMKENATWATTTAAGGGRKVADHLAAALAAGEIDEIHLVGHSAGSILLAPFAQRLVQQGASIGSVSLWAPACTIELFNSAYRPLIERGQIRAFDLYTLDDATEQDDDCANIYHKSLLYLVSGALEERPRIPVIRPIGTRLLGLARDAASEIRSDFWRANRRWFQAPGARESHARHHGDFDNDGPTLQNTLRRMLSARAPSQATIESAVVQPASALSGRRQALQRTIPR
jgi:hypothetical protein